MNRMVITLKTLFDESGMITSEDGKSLYNEIDDVINRLFAVYQEKGYPIHEISHIITSSVFSIEARRAMEYRYANKLPY